jgi:hypothetical protein
MATSPGLAARAVGAFPLSIGTSLALEGALGIYPERAESPAPILRCDELWCNLKTLFRNCIGALDRTSAATVLPNEMAWTLQEEASQIESLVAETTRNRVKTVFYVSNYVGLAMRYPHATLRADTTTRQKQYAAIQKATIELLLKSRRKPAHKHGGDSEDAPDDQLGPSEQSAGCLAVFDLKLAPVTTTNNPSCDVQDKSSRSFPGRPPPRVLLLTHYPYDLFSSRRFMSMTLLESHTGRLKEKALWHTKYHEGRSLAMIPFREDLIQVFGDAELFAPMRIDLRRELIEVAQKMQWNPTTTYGRIALGVDLIRNPYAREVLKKIISNRY